MKKQKQRSSGSVRLLAVLALVAGTMAISSGVANADAAQLDWNGKNGATACDANTTGTVLWIFSPHSDAVPVALFINGVQATGTGWEQMGNGSWHFTADIPGQFSDITSAYVTYTGTLGNNPVLTISGCNETTPQTASITIDKTIPNVLQGNETVTFTFQALLNDVVKGSCDITFTAGQTQGFCTIGNLQPNTTYTIHEVPNPPWAIQPDVDVTTGDAATDTQQSFVNSFGPATARACKVTDVDNTGHNASSDNFTFELKANGASIDTDPVASGIQADTVTVAGGGTVADPKCKSFATSLEEGVSYTIVEQTPATGWTLQSLVCDVDGTGPVTQFTPDYPGDADSVFTCTATNSITAAHATVRKITIPAGSEAGFTFHLLANGVDTGATATSTGNGALNFTPNVDLQDGVTYTVTEDPKPNWSSNGGVGCTFTPSYPADSGKTFNCVFTNTHVSQGLTIGYWKTHLTFDSKHPLAPYTAKYLPKSLGNYVVDTTAKATAVFNANCSSTTSQNSIACLAAQLLAAELNVANGADHCADAIIAKANSFLSGGTVDGVTGINYTGPTGNYSNITAAQRAKAISLKTALDTYNNGTCPA